MLMLRQFFFLLITFGGAAAFVPTKEPSFVVCNALLAHHSDWNFFLSAKCHGNVIGCNSNHGNTLHTHIQ